MAQKRVIASGGVFLPPPKINIASDAAHKGTSVSGIMDATQFIEVPLIGVPDELFASGNQLQLLRYRNNGSGYNAPINRYKRKAGWVHPAHFIGGAARTHTRGTGGGVHDAVSDALGNSAVLDAITEWDLGGLVYGDVIRIPVAEVFARWFRVGRVYDTNANVAGALAYVYLCGRSIGSTSGTVKRVSNRANAGKFAFRFAAQDADGQQIFGAESKTLHIGLPHALTISSGGLVPAREINPRAIYNATPQSNTLIARFRREPINSQI